MVCLKACRKGLRTTADVELIMLLLSGCDWTGSRPPSQGGTARSTEVTGFPRAELPIGQRRATS